MKYKLVMKFMEHGHKQRVIETEIGSGDRLEMESARKVFEAETNLNSLPGSRLRCHFNIEEVDL